MKNYFISAGGFPAKQHVNYAGEIVVRHDMFDDLNEKEVVMAMVFDEKFENANTGIISDMMYEIFTDWYDNGMKLAMEYFSFNLVADFWKHLISSVNNGLHKVQVEGKDSMGSSFAGIFIVGNEYIAMRAGNIEIYEADDECRSIFKRNASSEYVGRSEKIDIEVVRGICHDSLYTISSSKIINTEAGRKELIRANAGFDSAEDEIMKNIIDNAGEYIEINDGDTTDNLLVFIKSISDK